MKIALRGIKIMGGVGLLLVSPFFETVFAASFTSAIVVADVNMGKKVTPEFTNFDTKPAAASAAWLGVIGEFGETANKLVVFEKEGSLYIRQSGAFEYKLKAQSDNSFTHYNEQNDANELLQFSRDATGRAEILKWGAAFFPRNNIEPEAGQSFRVYPTETIENLTKKALGATPPIEQGDFVEPDLFDLSAVSATIKLDIRYAGTNNFVGEPIYAEAKAFLQRTAAHAVGRAHAKLRQYGYGLLIHDAYRPWYVSKIFWDATPEKDRVFVADPSKGSRHNRGAAVDLTLYDLATGDAVQMVGTYDEMSDRSYPDYEGGTSLQRWHRGLLREVMESEGFTVYEAEWWHFDYDGWETYPILNKTFSQLAVSDK